MFEQVDPNHYRALAHDVVDSGAGRSTAFHRSASASTLRHPVRARKRTTAMAAGQTRAASTAQSASPKASDRTKRGLKKCTVDHARSAAITPLDAVARRAVPVYAINRCTSADSLEYVKSAS